MRKGDLEMLRKRLLVTALSALAILPAMAGAQQLSFQPETMKAAATTQKTSGPVLRSWMSSEIADAWRQGYQGQGVTVTVVDGFTGSGLVGNLGTGTLSRTHGEWTREQIIMSAPRATIRSQDFSNTRAVSLARGQNVLNLSYGMFADAGYNVSQIGWGAREASIIRYARDGNAVVVKAAGNDGVAVGTATAFGDQDYLASALIGTRSGIFVGALNDHGTVDRKASLAWYSNTAGTDTRVQDKFLVVGVTGHLTGLYGTSFAAPIVSSYAAVLGSKFTRATPEQISNQLLNTARTDTILGYDRAVHGRGEASIGRALAPAAIR
jgi:subtilisin family serine protease